MVLLTVSCDSANDIENDTSFKITQNIESANIIIGDQIKYSVEVNIEDMYNLDFIPFENDSTFEIESQINSDNNTNIILSFWKVGESLIPEMEIEVYKDNILDTLLIAPSFSVEVSSSINHDMNDIHSIKDMVEIDLLNKSNTILLLAIIMVVVVLLLLLLIKYKRGKVSLSEVSLANMKSPYELAMERLDLLIIPQNITETLAEKFYLDLSKIFKSYFSSEYFIKMNEMTSSEMKIYLSTMHVEPQVMEKTIRLIDRSDLSKYARHIPTSKDIEDDLLETKYMVKLYHNLFAEKIK